MSEVRVTATGKLTSEPKITEVNGKTKAVLTIATNPQMFKDGQFKDLPVVFTTVEFWGGLATAIAASYTTGSLVVATGVMRANEYEDGQGQQKRFQYLRGEEIGRHIADRSQTNQPQQSSSGSQWGQSGDNGGGWGNSPSGSANGPYSPDSASQGPYSGQGQPGPYDNAQQGPYSGGRQWGQP